MEEKDRFLHPSFVGLDYTDETSFIAHWIWHEDDKFYVLKIANEKQSVGLESNPGKHPDQTFWKQSLISRPDPSAAIVTDCKLLPCDNNLCSCMYQVPALIKDKFGKGIPIAFFAHNDYISGRKGRFGYYTTSGASKEKLEADRENIFTWDWSSDESEYFD